jgi:hypothetical protein
MYWPTVQLTMATSKRTSSSSPGAPLEFDGDRVHLVYGVAKLLDHCVVLLDHALADVNTNKLGRMGHKTSGYQTWKHSVIVVTHDHSMA